jgi:hypothetical protein
MKMRDLASFAGATGRPRDHRHVPDCCHVERETLAASQSRSFDDLDFGQLVVPPADAVDGLGAEKDAAPEFASFKFGGSDNAAKYRSIAPAARRTRGADR